MKKIFKNVLAAAFACVTAVIMSLSVSAETEDVELSTANAVTTNGAWGQTLIYDRTYFDCSRMTPDSVVYVEYELDGEWVGTAGAPAPVELILQNYSTADPQIWARVQPFEWDDTSASFDYDSMVDAFGSDDFSGVDNLCLGDCSIVMTATKFTITNCTVEEVTTTAETTEKVTEAVTEETTAEAVTEAVTETTAAAAAPAEEESEDSSFTVVLIVVIAVVAVAVVVGLLVFLKTRRRFY